MNIRIDKAADALYIDFAENQFSAVPLESEEVQPGIIVDFDAQGVVVGIEVLEVSKRTSSALRHIHIETIEA